MNNTYETSERFSREKARILGRDDLSKAGKIDKEIRQLVEEINSKKDYCTTSSCAGRITLLERRSNRKDESRWLIASHIPVRFDEVKENFKSDFDVWIMQESFILHIFCRDLASAERMLSACKSIGLKRTGIVSISKKIMIETMGNEKVETIVIKQGKVLVDDECLKAVLAECNARMEKNRKKMENLYEKIKKL